MLTSLFIRDFAIVRQLELSLESGLSVFTGETGAGKSIMVDALALALGERADSEVIRPGCDQAEIVAGFHLEAGHDAAAWLTEHDLLEDGECILRRVLHRERSSRGFINGRPVPMQMLRELGERLVDIHGQHEHQSLLRRDAQRQILDDAAGHGEAVAQLAAAFRELRALDERIDALRARTHDRDSRLDLLRYQVQELEALGLGEDELAELEQEHERLAHSSELVEGVQGLCTALYDGDEGTVVQSLGHAASRLQSLGTIDPALAENSELLNQAAIQVEEAAAALRRYLDRLDLDPQRLVWVDQRLGTIHDLARKHRVRPPELAEVTGRLRAELSELEDLDERLTALEGQRRSVLERYVEQAGAVSGGRRGAAQRLGRRVTAQMQELGMTGGRFEASVAPLADDTPTAYGLDRVEFLVTANPGQPVRPLAKVASGGELSRISLAVQVETASLGRVPTLIFDEVDVGIGGGVAEIVGQKLRALGHARQVLCITHLAQVAAQGTHQWRVVKRAAPDVEVGIEALEPQARVQEIARMIGGVTITDQTLAHAREMLDRAAGA
jgi:DNA repair protein RecN (Recombination protein N)